MLATGSSSSNQPASKPVSFGTPPEEQATPGVGDSGAGKQRLHLLDGGLDAWATGGDVVRGSSETWALDRQVRLVAGSLSLAGLLTSVEIRKAV